MAKVKKKDKKQKAVKKPLFKKNSIQLQMTATSGVLVAARELAQKIYVEFTNDGEADFVLKPGDEEIRALWIALDVYDSDDTGLYTPYDPPKIEYPVKTLWTIWEVEQETGIDGRAIRRFLRDEANFVPERSGPGNAYRLNAEQVQAVRERFPEPVREAV